MFNQALAPRSPCGNLALPQVSPPRCTAAWRHTLLARLANVIFWTMWLLAALIIYAAVSGNVQPDMVMYWWVAAVATTSLIYA